MNGAPSDPKRQPPGPQGGWFEALWDRDFPIMKGNDGDELVKEMMKAV